MMVSNSTKARLRGQPGLLFARRTTAFVRICREFSRHPTRRRLHACSLPRVRVVELRPLLRWGLCFIAGGGDLLSRRYPDQILA